MENIRIGGGGCRPTVLGELPPKNCGGAASVVVGRNHKRTARVIRRKANCDITSFAGCGITANGTDMDVVGEGAGIGACKLCGGED